MPPAIVRRLISVPAVLLVATFLWSTMLLWLPLLWLVDKMAGKSYWRATFFLTWFTLMDSIGILALLLSWLSLPLVGKSGLERQTLAIQRFWAAGVWSGAVIAFRASIRVTGEDSILPMPAVILPRHTSLADTMLAQLVIQKPYKTLLRYVLKQELLWEPCLDIAGNRLPNVFVKRNSGNVERELEQISQGVADLGRDEGILLYPEGTRFNPKLSQSIKSKMAGQIDPNGPIASLEHVLPAKPAGLFTILDAVPDLDVVFMAHVGFDSFRNLSDLTNGTALDTVCKVHCWRVAARDIPAELDARSEWLAKEWKKMDEMVVELS
ncbi:MAG: 1-acyl-sn-glycerol-3-phosphate acyltransferase [Gammaproteobacteria bacterium]|jgi:1-acyl-sn-glycerol-3-phosphate acyltransferase